MNTNHVAVRVDAAESRRRVPPAAHLLLVALAWLPSALMAQSAISADGVIESESGGFKFPDGSVQITAIEVTDPCVNPADPADEMIRVGGICIDKYEASVWSASDGGIQYGVDSDDYPCSDNGQDCAEEGKKIYARSVEGVPPSARITWFQAQVALANSGKRLPSNAEWQMAVTGTPDPGTDDDVADCNVNFDSGQDPVATGSRSSCVSVWGAHDMVGNLWEWVADWGDNATACTNWSSTYGDDISCVGLGEGEANSHFPGAVLRGGNSSTLGTDAGPFAVSGVWPPSFTNPSFGFRGVR